MERNRGKLKQPSLFRQWLTIKHEQALTRKALRLLKKQEWSVDFLTALLIRAANIMNRPLQMTIASPSGIKVSVNTIDTPTSTYRDDSIFNHLDDETRIQAFINEVNS